MQNMFIFSHFSSKCVVVFRTATLFLWFLCTWFSFFASVSFSILKGEDILDTAVYGGQTNTEFPRDQTQQEIDKVFDSIGKTTIQYGFAVVCSPYLEKKSPTTDTAFLKPWQP